MGLDRGVDERANAFDLVTIGGGFAGLCAAVRGAALGLRTAVPFLVVVTTHNPHIHSSQLAFANLQKRLV